MRFEYLAILIFYTCTSLGASISTIPSRQALVRLKSESYVERFKKKLPAGFEVIRVYKNSILLRSDHSLSKKDLTFLQSNPMVSHAEIDSPASYKGSATSSETSTSCTADLTANDPIRDIRKVANSLPVTKCGVFDLCPMNGQSLNWAQQSVNGDLMLDELKKFPKLGSVKIGVIDTGFDSSALKLIDASHFKIEHAKGDTTDLRKDAAGHGTAVMGLISGKDGVGLSPESIISFYKVGGEETTFDNLKLFLEKACDDGNEIINFSWGVLADETGHFRWETQDPAFVKSFTDRGCLIVAGAGNDGYKQHYDTDNPDDAFLRVESNYGSGNLADYSTVGEISAPGFRDRSIQPDGHSTFFDEQKDSAQCGVSNIVTVAGTSFATPIVTAIGSQVIKILKSESTYESLSKPDRISLINRILLASRNGSREIDGLRAVKIAKAWTEKPSVGVPTTDELSKMLSMLLDPACKIKVVSSCVDAPCDHKKECLFSERRRASLCDNLSPKELGDLAFAAQQEGDLELAAKYYNQIASSGNTVDIPSLKSFDWTPISKAPNQDLFVVSDFYQSLVRATGSPIVDAKYEIQKKAAARWLFEPVSAHDLSSSVLYRDQLLDKMSHAGLIDADYLIALSKSEKLDPRAADKLIDLALIGPDYKEMHPLADADKVVSAVVDRDIISKGSTGATVHEVLQYLDKNSSKKIALKILSSSNFTAGQSVHNLDLSYWSPSEKENGIWVMNQIISSNKVSDSIFRDDFIRGIKSMGLNKAEAEPILNSILNSPIASANTKDKASAMLSSL